MLNQIAVDKYLNKLTDPRYGSLHSDAENDFKVIKHHIYRAHIALAFFQGADFEKCMLGRWTRSWGSIKPKDNPLIAVNGQINFQNKEIYRLFVVGQFFSILSEVCSAADIIGGLLNQCYPLRDSLYTVITIPYFQLVLESIKNSTRTSAMQTFLNSTPAILDYRQSLPTTPMTNVDLRNCNFSYQLVRKLRNVPEHNSYEGLITMEASHDSLASTGDPNYYACISDDADTICGLTTEFWPRLSRRKDGSRDISKLSEWILENFIIHTNQIIDFAGDDL